MDTTNTTTSRVASPATIMDNGVLSALADGPKTAAELYELSGLGGRTGAELGRLVAAGLVERQGGTFALTEAAPVYAGFLVCFDLWQVEQVQSVHA